jgi:hypothetical protein
MDQPRCNGILKKIRDAIPTAEIQRSTDTAVAILILTISEATIGDGDAWIARAQMAWKWKTELQTPQRFLEILRNLLFQKKENNPGDFIVGLIAQEAVDIMWAGQEGSQHIMTVGNDGSQHRGERSWWAQGPGCLARIQEWRQRVQQSHAFDVQKSLATVTFAGGVVSVTFTGNQRICTMTMDKGDFLDRTADEPAEGEPIVV